MDLKNKAIACEKIGYYAVCVHVVVETCAIMKIDENFAHSL